MKIIGIRLLLDLLAAKLTEIEQRQINVHLWSSLPPWHRRPEDVLLAIRALYSGEGNAENRRFLSLSGHQRHTFAVPQDLQTRALRCGLLPE